MAQAQPTFNGVLDLAFMLPIDEQMQLVKQLQSNLFEQIEPHVYHHTTEEQKARLRKAHEDSLAGDILTREEAHQMQDEYIQSLTRKVI